MADYGTIGLEPNTGTDASPVWGTAITLSGSGGNNQMRLGSGTATTGSANWPFIARPVAGTSAITQLWACTTDTSCAQVSTYTGDNTKANVFRWSFDNAGNPTSAMQWSFFGDSTHTAPTPGTQPPGTHQDPFTNGQITDTSNTSYIKINAYGSGLTAAGVQETPAAGTIGTMPAATTGTAGATTTTAGNWLNTNGAWTSAQGFVQYILGGAIVHTAQAFKWYGSAIVFLGANISTGTINFVQTLQYTFS